MSRYECIDSMPSNPHGPYDLIEDIRADECSKLIAIYVEHEIQNGIRFKAKYIGSMEISRPSSRIEIVAAMRRVRYEFKARNIKKKPVDIVVSVEGVKVVLQRKKEQEIWDESRLLVMSHPIYRIFYVSHDSQDLQIFSYIARDGPLNTFKCNVFKGYEEMQAMKIVQRIGQAFEVSHRAEEEKNIDHPIEESRVTEVRNNSLPKTKTNSEKICHNYVSQKATNIISKLFCCC